MVELLKKREWYVVLLIGVFSVFKIHLGLHFDESINVAMGDMLLKESGLLADNWSTLQFTGIFIAPLLWLHDKLFGGILGEMLFLRYNYLIIQGLVAYFTYSTVKKHASKENAFLAGICVYVYVFNWQAITYKSILFWGCLLMILCLIRYYDTERVAWLVLAAVSLCIAILGFLGGIVMVVPAVIVIYKKNHNLKPVVLFGAVCFVLACVVLGYSAWGHSWNDVFGGLFQVLHADTYEEFLLLKALRIGGKILVIALGANLLYIAVLVYNKKFKKNLNVHHVMTVVLLMTLTAICLARVKSISASRVFYVLTMVFALIPIDTSVMVKENELEDRQRRWMLMFFYLPSIFMMIAIMLATKQDIVPTIYGVILGLLGIIVIYPHKRMNYGLNQITALLLILSFVIFIPDQSGKDKLIQARVCIERGPARGLYVSENETADYYRVCDAVEANVLESDALLITGDHYKSNGYMCTEAKYGVYTTFNIDADAEKLYEYYSSNLERIPTIILYDQREAIGLDEWLNTKVGSLLSQYFDTSNIQVYDDYYVLRQKKQMNG